MKRGEGKEKEKAGKERKGRIHREKFPGLKSFTGQEAN